MSLDDFLTLPEVKAKGITKENCKYFVNPSPMHLVSNANSSRSLKCMCVNLNWVNKVTQSTVNDLIHTGLHGLSSMQSVILQYRFSLTSCLADLSCFYKRNLLDVRGSLMREI